MIAEPTFPQSARSAQIRWATRHLAGISPGWSKAPFALGVAALGGWVDHIAGARSWHQGWLLGAGVLVLCAIPLVAAFATLRIRAAYARSFGVVQARLASRSGGLSLSSRFVLLGLAAAFLLPRLLRAASQGLLPFYPPTALLGLFSLLHGLRQGRIGLHWTAFGAALVATSWISTEPDLLSLAVVSGGILVMGAIDHTLLRRILGPGAEAAPPASAGETLEQSGAPTA